MGMNVFPPIVDEFQPAFINSTEYYPIYFNYSELTNSKRVKNIQIKISFQKTNENAVDTNKYSDGIIYYQASEIGYDESLGKNYVYINSADLKERWQAGVYYKIQLRLGVGEEEDIYDSSMSFQFWKKTQIEKGNFSEWSTILTLYPISAPKVSILNNHIFKTNIILDIKNVEFTLTPTLVGRYENDNYEPVEKYKFYLYDAATKEILEESDWLLYDSSNDEFNENQKYVNIFKYRFKQLLSNSKNYIVNYEIITRNQYRSFSENYMFSVSYSPNLNNQIILYSLDNFENSYSKADEEGVITILINSKCINESTGEQVKVSGNYVLVRASERDNFKEWEDLTYFTFANETVSKFYEDYAVESGIRYKYKIEKENLAGIRTEIIEDSNYNNGGARVSNFSYSYLYNNDKQLKLKFNNTISSYKKTRIESKLDSLNSKFPYISRNGAADYAEFTINGFISFDVVEEETTYREIKNSYPSGDIKIKKYSTFLNKIEGVQNKEEGYYYNNELIIPKRKYSQFGKNNKLIRKDNKIIEELEKDRVFEFNSYNQNLIADNIYIERKFREKALEFLQDGKPKLYKSPTEGNMIVSLLNVSLTPDTVSNRKIYSFSATAYEISECNYKNLKKYNMIQYNNHNSIIKGKEEKFGQILGYYEGIYSRSEKENGRELYPLFNSKKQNLSEIIKEQVKKEMHDKNYQYVLNKITSIQVESYPKISLKKEILGLEYEIAQEANKIHTIPNYSIETYEKLLNKKNYLIKLQKEINYSGKNPFYTLIIDGKEINLNPNIPYQLKDVSIKDIYLKYSGAILLNYICEVSTVESIKEVEKVRATLRTWNQIEGMFSNTKQILSNYLNEKQEQKISNNKIENQISNYPYRNIGLYNTLNIMDIIKEKSKREVENKQGIKLQYFHYLQDSSNEKEYYDVKEQFYYQFKKLEYIAIEGNPGTHIKITSYPYTGSNEPIEEEIIIGKTGKIKYENNKNYLVQNIELSQSEYLIVDFSCEIIISEKGTERGV